MEKEAQVRAPSLWGWFFASRVLVFMASPAISGDVDAYFEGVARCVARGTPYGEDGFGYPALAFLFVSIPWLLGATQLEIYAPLYRAQCFAVDVLLFHLLSRRCGHSSLLVYIVCTTLLGALLYNRLDILLGLLLVAALVLEARGSAKLASLALGASIAFKVIPVLLLPAWLMWAVRRRSPKAALGALGLVVLGAGVPIGLAWALWGKDALFFMDTHARRGIQLESTWASIGILLMGLGLPGKTYFAAGSYNLSTPLEGVFATGSHIAVLAAALWGGVISARLARGGQALALALTSTLGALLLLSKVFSPQYLLFFLPPLALSFDAITPRVRRLAMTLAVASCVLTTWVYPYHEKELEALAGVATVPLVLRNALFTFLVVLLQVDAWRCGQRARGKASASE